MERVIDGYGGEREKDDDELTRAAERVSELNARYFVTCYDRLSLTILSGVL